MTRLRIAVFVAITCLASFAAAAQSLAQSAQPAVDCGAPERGAADIVDVANLRIADLLQRERNLRSLIAATHAHPQPGQAGPYSMFEIQQKTYDLWMAVAGYGLAAEP